MMTFQIESEVIFCLSPLLVVSRNDRMNISAIFINQISWNFLIKRDVIFGLLPILNRVDKVYRVKFLYRYNLYISEQNELKIFMMTF